MIQRIQSVYLLLIAGILLAMLFFPAITITSPVAETGSIESCSFLTAYLLPGLLVVTAILSLVTIFAYKKRRLQMKICYGIVVLIVLICSLYLFVYFVLTSNVARMTEVTIAFPLIALILDFMAISGIKKDEKLVRSLDRLR